MDTWAQKHACYYEEPNVANYIMTLEEHCLISYKCGTLRCKINSFQKNVHMTNSKIKYMLKFGPKYY